MAASGGKQYGLILSQKSTKLAPVSRPSIFGDDSDDETSVGESLQKEANKKKMMKQTRLEMQKALDEDSSVYEYDSVYDDIQKKRLESNKKLLGGADRKPKYITQIMRAVEERKKEQERRDDRKIQKEREAEGEKFADKEAYVTSAYKQKLKEREEELEREKRAAEIEAALDVKKQKDLSGFYRHLLNQTVGEEALPDRSADRKEKSKSPVKTSPPRGNDSGADSNEERSSPKAEFSKSGGNSSHSKRQYRQRSPSSGSEDDRKKEKKREKEKRAHRERERARSRDREREEQHGHRREKEKERHRDRDADRGRERKDRDKDRETEDRHLKRNRADGDQDRHRDRDDKKEREKKAQGDEKEKDKKAENAAETNAAEPSKFLKRSNEQTVSSARERFLARQMARSAAKSYVEKEDV
ncbi:nuclear speckle splicing regulatory protein 1 [Silurus meridionalis]|uniref:Nuclear speckle splicing regulatory protein 1 n=1 Tax=Silurus meridionalis TaxID=175797 RepID=A0A8T0AZN8_SILME|nr:nuclear speckle splicing regulatory protein 1 [Silurus meridionalis]KAF7697302.1 hypothetical protein HF521_005720 [Silurus meridionalis]